VREMGWLVRHTYVGQGRATEAKCQRRGVNLPFAGFGPFLEERLGTLDRVL
jgi:hypothetical protein